MSSSRTDARRQLVDVTMPQMGVSVAEGTIVGWRVEVGDRIAADETICDISTDKIDTEVPAPVTGMVAEIIVPVDETVSVGTVLARIAVGSDGAARGPGPFGRFASIGRRRTPRSPRSAGAVPALRPAPARPRGFKAAGTPRSFSGSPPSTASTCRRWRAPDAVDGSASRTCSRSWNGSGRDRPASRAAAAHREPVPT